MITNVFKGFCAFVVIAGIYLVLAAMSSVELRFALRGQTALATITRIIPSRITQQCSYRRPAEKLCPAIEYQFVDSAGTLIRGTMLGPPKAAVGQRFTLQYGDGMTRIYGDSQAPVVYLFILMNVAGFCMFWIVVSNRVGARRT